jgi:hypothetical protein
MRSWQVGKFPGVRKGMTGGIPLATRSTKRACQLGSKHCACVGLEEMACCNLHPGRVRLQAVRRGGLLTVGNKVAQGPDRSLPS